METLTVEKNLRVGCLAMESGGSGSGVTRVKFIQDGMRKTKKGVGIKG